MPVPDELVRALKVSKRVEKFFNALSPHIRNWVISMITSAKQPETRKRRAERAAEQLMELMEAERELPPMIRQALDRNPDAAEGWRLMPPSHRRGHLFGIFYYQDFEARRRRLERALEQMVEFAERRR